MFTFLSSVPWFWIAGVIALAALILPSLHNIGPTEVGLVLKRFSLKKLQDDNPIAFNGEAGYQADLLMPGWRFKLWLLFQVTKHPWVQVPAGEIGVVIAQVGKPLPPGAKSGIYKPEFGNFTNARNFVAKDGQKGLQRPTLPPGSSAPMHPVGFLVITKERVYGLPIAPDLKRKGALSSATFGIKLDELSLVQVRPVEQDVIVGDKTVKRVVDMIGVVTALEGDPLTSGDIACRLGGFSDIQTLLSDTTKSDADIIEVLLGNKNALHNNYQDFQKFLDAGGKIGTQHDPLMPGAYALNPLLVRVEQVPMLTVSQGEVAVITAFVGLMTEDVSGTDYKHGSLVRPGRRGIWDPALRTGKYAINPRCYKSEIVPTAILTLNWAEAVSKAHNLDAGLNQIDAKSKEGFEFAIDLQVQIHVPDTKASRVIAMVGTMYNLVNEVLQAAVGNHFRDKLQSLPAVEFIQTRQSIQNAAFEHIKSKLADYNVETRGVYIQDVVLPKHLVEVLTEREIANQQIATYKMQKSAQDQRVEMEQATGMANMQAELAKSRVGIDIATNNANAKTAQAAGEAAYLREVGAAKAVEVEADGKARAMGFQAQREAIGAEATAVVNAIRALGDGHLKVTPDVLVNGSQGGGGIIEMLFAMIGSNMAKGQPALGGSVQAAVPAPAAGNGAPKAPVAPAPSDNQA